MSVARKAASRTSSIPDDVAEHRLVKWTIAANATRKQTQYVDIPAALCRYLYVERELSCDEIAPLLGVSKCTVKRRLREHGIPIRSLTEAFAVSRSHQRNAPRCGDSSPGWRGGRRRHTRYVQVLSRSHPDVGASGYIFEHRLVAERMLGRRLLPTEVVRHVNGDGTDNRPENLRVMPRAEHMSLLKAAYWAARRQQGGAR